MLDKFEHAVFDPMHLILLGAVSRICRRLHVDGDHGGSKAELEEFSNLGKSADVYYADVTAEEQSDPIVLQSRRLFEGLQAQGSLDLSREKGKQRAEKQKDRATAGTGRSKQPTS